MSKILIQAMVLLLMAFPLTGCDIDQTEEGEMPDVDVEGGEMPKYDVDPADVDVEMEEKEVLVPDVDVDMPEDDEPEDEVVDN